MIEVTVRLAAVNGYDFNVEVAAVHKLSAICKQFKRRI